MIIKISEIEKIITITLLKKYSPEQAELIRDVVLFGELSGRPSHGLLRLLPKTYGVFTDTITGEPEFIKKTKVSTLINGHGNVGMLIASLAMKEVIYLAKENGIGIVGTKNSVNSTGALFYYCEKIANENLIGIVFAHSVPMIAPFASKKALFGTNPIAFGIPSLPHPIIFDMSTSAITYGSIVNHKLQGKQLPKNVAIDKEGNMTTDPEKALGGATLAFDNSYKGSGLALMVEILAAVWTGANYAGHNEKEDQGNLFIALSPELLTDSETLKARSRDLIEIIQKVETRDGKTSRIPGENTFQIRNNNLKRGEVEVDESLLKKIKVSI